MAWCRPPAQLIAMSVSCLLSFTAPAEKIHNSKERETETETERDRGRQTDRDSETKRDRERDRNRERQRETKARDRDRDRDIVHHSEQHHSTHELYSFFTNLPYSGAHA